MNPLAWLIIALGIMIMIIGLKGSQHRIIAALTNKPPKTS